LWAELAIDRPWDRRKKKEDREPSTGPVPDWSQYEEYPHVQSDPDSYEDEYTVQTGE
jgi:hypothetical protein